MESIIKRNIKDNGIALGEIARELSINEDRITAMNNNPEGTPLGRIIGAYDHIGMVPVELLRDISNNVIALDKLEPSPDNFLSTRAKIEKVIEEHIEEYGEPSKVSRTIINAFEREYRYPIIYITGSEGCGKAAMAENLMGTELKFANRMYERKYRHLLLMSDKRSRIEYNYPFGEYSYRIRESERIPELLKEDFTTETPNWLEPVSAMDTQSLYSYAVYSDRPLLDSVNIVCSNTMLLSPDAHDFEEVANTDAQLISMSDIIVIMLDDTSAECLKLADILQHAFLRWGKDMTDHVIFTIAKSDRRPFEGDDGINERIEKYSKYIRDIFENLELIKNNPEKDLLLNHITDVIFPYSSIYKKHNTQHKVDAMHNTDFYKKIHSMVFMALDDVKHREKIYDVISQESDDFFPKAITFNSILDIFNILPITNDDAVNLKYGIHEIFSDGKKNFEINFSKRYSETISVDRIMQIIDDYKLTTADKFTRNDKLKLISIVNSLLTVAVRESAYMSFSNMHEQLKNKTHDIVSERIENNLLGSFTSKAESLLKKYNTEMNKIKNHIPTTESKPSEDELTRSEIAAMALTLPLTLPIIAGVATANAVSYYAQTNFKKNTARKIAALYNDNDIKNKFMNKVKETYFDNLERELKEIIDSYTYKCDKKTGSFIEKIEEAIDVENLIQVTGVFDELAHLTS